MSYFDDASLVMIPSGYKDQKVYSVKPLDGSGDLTFSRASSATRVASNGLIEKVRTNLILQSEDFTTSWFPNIAPTITANTTVAPNGTTTADTIASSGTGSGVFQVPTVVNGVEYSFSIYVKNISSATNIRIGCDLAPANGLLNFNAVTGAIISTGAGITGSSVTNVGNGWYRVSGTYITTGTTNTFVVFGESAMSFAVWGAQLETGVTTDYIATTSAAVSVGPVSGLPRLDYLNSTCPRLLLEGQRSNLITNSEAAASWIAANVTFLSNTVTSPDGYQDADTVTADGTSNPHYFGFNAPSVTTGTAYTASIFVKNGTGQYFQLLFGSGGFSTTKYINYDLTAGTITYTGTGASGTITSYGNGWYRLTMTATCDTSTTETFYGAIITTSTASRAQFNTSTAYYYVWGAQLEAGAYATSYIPTLGTSVTRVAETASKTSASGIIGQTEGTVLWEFQLETPVATGHEDILNIDAGSFGNTIYFFKASNGSLTVEMYVSSVAQASFTKTGITAGTYKCAFGYAANNTAFFVNGVQVGSTDTSCSVPAMNRIQLGNGVLGPSTGLTKQLLLFPTRLSNSDLAALTA